MNVAMLFPGQASQYVGMGKDYYDAYREARDLYQEANDKLGFNITELSFSGDLEELTKTHNAQPAILLHSIVVLTVLENSSIKPEIVAGHSLGEFSALVAAGFFKPMDALLIVRHRGELMFEAGLKRPGTMAAVVGLRREEVEECVAQASSNGVVVVANYNSPNQFVVSGEVGAVEGVLELAREQGARRAMKLQVSGAFHSPLMEETARDLRKYIERFEKGKLLVPWIANVTGKIITERDLVMDLLFRQLSSPVLWADSMKTLAASTSADVLEVGPGKVLTGLLKRTNSEMAATSLSSVDDLGSIA